MVGKRQHAVILCLILLITAVGSCAALAASEPMFRLDMTKLNLQKGVSTSLTLSLINAQGAEVLGIEGLEHFELLSRSQSTSINIVNGRSTHQIDFHYTIMPKETGQFTLQARVQYNGQVYESNELQVTVSDAPAEAGRAEGDLFVRTVLSQDEIYLGEKVVLTYELYSRYSIENLGFTDYTSIDGVVAKEISADQLKAEYVYLDGVRYAKYEVMQLIIDPIRAGTVTIPAFNLQVNVIVDGFGGALGGLFSRTRPMYLQTQAQELKVQPLPAAGRPKDFSGIVGELQLEGNYTKQEVQFGDPLSLLVTASGSCNLDSLKKLFPGSIPGFAVYETQKHSTETVQNNQYYAEKQFEVILVPQQTGLIEVVPVSISYFNPRTGQYEYAEIPGTTIQVAGSMPVQASSGGEARPTAVETVSVVQVSYLDTSGDYFTIRISKQQLLWVLLGIFGLLILVLIGIWLAAKGKQRDPKLKSLYKQLMAAKGINEAYDLFNEMIKHSFNLSIKASPRSVVQAQLPPHLAVEVVKVMDYMESSSRECSELKDKVKRIYKLINS